MLLINLFVMQNTIIITSFTIWSSYYYRTLNLKFDTGDHAGYTLNDFHLKLERVSILRLADIELSNASRVSTRGCGILW